MSSLLSYAFGALAFYPNVQKRVFDEIQAVCGDEPFDKSHADRLRETEAWLLESLRVWPPFSVLTRRLKQNWTIQDNVTLPPGVCSSHLFCLNE